MTTDQFNPGHVINYAFLLGGIVSFVFGLILVIRQDQAVGIVALLLGLWWLIQGVFLLFSVLIDQEEMWWKLLLGIIGLTAGIVVLANPVQTADLLGSALAIFLGVMGLLMGLVSIIGGFGGKNFGSIVFGVLTVGVGLLLLFFPQDSFRTFVTIVGIVLMVQGLAGALIGLTAKDA